MAFIRDTEEYVKAESEHLVRPFSVVGQPVEMVIAEAKGIMLRDTEGREYIDATSGAMCVNIGHGRTELSEAAANQMSKLAYSLPFQRRTNTAAVECAQRLASMTPEGVNHFFFTSGGSETVETCLKLARLYWYNKGGKTKYKVIALYGGYHGASYGAVSATASRPDLWQGFTPLVPGFLHLPRYYCYRCDFGLTYPGCDIRCAHYLEDVIQKEGPDSVAAFIAEPVQGAGGMIPPPPEYWPIVREICTRNEVLLIADEVITGFGRTGKLFGVENWGIRPDLMCMAKGITSAYLPFGAAGVSDMVYEALKDRSLVHAYTYSGHPVCCAVATKNMEILLEERLTENAAEMGQYLGEHLKELEKLPHVAAATNLGLMAGFELVADKATKKSFDPALNMGEKVVTRAMEQGLILRSVGQRIYFAPPLITTRQQMDQIFDILEPVTASVTG